MSTFAVRRGQRRRSFALYLGTERRSGFDRRPDTTAGGGLLPALHGNPLVLAMLLLAINAMNAVDFFLTVGALKSGYSEANPVMAAVFARGNALAGGFKFAVVGAAALVIWHMRRYRMILGVALFACALFGGVLMLHAYGRLTI